ncbi:WD40-repeat-containing domain protein [Cristinia sonorae]|uniref:WD40-repeat-containing domain protein n=1 Tax=Cristinia sonorae TaxID=1940300 RepID=A0A8K0UHY8_9AGAR|nr:WD40-repeat-containing domain protein [Cristinia sonorae]
MPQALNVNTDNALGMESLPSRVLTNISSLLPPSSLLALGSTNKHFREHLEDEKTWKSAYYRQFLGIPFEDIRSESTATPAIHGSILVRRTKVSWKGEFIHRWNLLSRYEQSRSTPISHCPVQSIVTDLQYIPHHTSPGLLAVSAEAHVVARSYPLNGKLLPGFLHASTGGFKPDKNFAPKVSKIAVTIHDGSARIMWGHKSGTVSVTNNLKRIVPPAPALREETASKGDWSRCTPEEQHDGPVEDAVWGAATGELARYFVTGGADGRVKLWDGQKVKCLWTSEVPDGDDPYVKVAIDLPQGIIAAATYSGEISVWTGLSEAFGGKELLNSDIRQTKLTPPPAPALPAGQILTRARRTSALHIHFPSADVISLLLVYNVDKLFFRSDLNIRTGSVERTTYGDGRYGAITAIQPVFGPDGTSFVVVGDQLGFVSIYPWADTCPISPVAPLRVFKAHGNGAVTALKWTPTVLVTGSSGGTAEVWDSIRFEHLRSFPARKDPISQIIVENEVVVLSTGKNVVVWAGTPWPPRAAVTKTVSGDVSEELIEDDE